MSPDDDPLFEGLATLPPITPEAEWEARVRARCHSAISKRASRRAHPGRSFSSAALAGVLGAVLLCAYLASMLAQAVRLGR